jgi:aspartate-semialdehyde dehydrogenase
MIDGELALAELAISAEATRVPVRDGHLAVVSVRLDDPATPEEAIEALRAWQPPAIAAELPSSPARTLVYYDEPDRPQPRRDRDGENGLAWTVGNVRRCPVLDLRYMALTHNTLRGAASGAVLNAELLVAQGIISRP